MDRLLANMEDTIDWANDPEVARSWLLAHAPYSRVRST